MSKLQKGRRHRKVNRTPRPVGPATRATATRATTVRTAPAPEQPERAPVPEPASAPGSTSAPVAASVPDPAPAPDAVPAPAASVPAPTRPPESLGALFRTPAREGGLGQSAARTWEEVRHAGSAGVTVEELAARVGYQSRTIAKHLLGLAEHGVVEQHAPDRWRPVSPETDSPDEAATVTDVAAGPVPQHA